MLIKIFLPILFLTHLISSEPIVLTDKTWSQILNGEWMVEFYAPWCPACKQFKPVWEQFSSVAASKNVKIAAVDVEEYPALSGRFRISALPTVFHVKNGVFRQFNGERSLKNLKYYIDNQEWTKTEPISSYLAPDSILMSLTSSLFDVTALVKYTHALLQDYYGWPSWLIYSLFVVGVLCIGIFIGFSFLQILDYFSFLPSTKQPSATVIPEDTDELDESETQDESILKTISTDDSDNDQQPITTDQTVRQRRAKN